MAEILLEWVSDESLNLPNVGIMSKGRQFQCETYKGESLIRQGYCKKVNSTKKLKLED